MSIKFSPDQLIRDEHFLVLNKEIRQTKNGDNFLILELSNQTGKIEAKVWGNNIPQCQVEIGKVIEVNGKTQEYNGKISLIIDRCQIVLSEEITEYREKTPTLVFDIETVGKKFEELDEREQDYLLNNLEKGEEDKEKAKNKIALYSIFGKVVAIGVWDFEKNKGKVLIISDKDLVPEKDSYEYFIFKDEKELLKGFWKLTTSFEKFVTYNGDNFDLPYLMIRSGINRIKMPFEIKKWGSDKFIDLANKIRQSHSFKLEMLCKAFGIENPKEKGVEGSEVTKLFYNGEYQKIADYVARDAYSTNELYKIWKEFMSGEI
ncbi:MAG: 3'-5' exonuclease [Candidatus Shapirobacteria bacterium]|nr:3'-5' exonuclease [Candidatus Shapirobacteria bacterium]